MGKRGVRTYLGEVVVPEKLSEGEGLGRRGEVTVNRWWRNSSEGPIHRKSEVLSGD